MFEWYDLRVIDHYHQDELLSSGPTLLRGVTDKAVDDTACDDALPEPEPALC